LPVYGAKVCFVQSESATIPFSHVFAESIIGIIAAIAGFRVVDRAIMQVLFIFFQEWTDSCDEEIRFIV
jgi:hypothetical protein